MSQDLTGISPAFDIDHNSDYLLEGYIGRESDAARCFLDNDATPLVNGVGVRFSLYNSIGERLTPLDYSDYNVDGLYENPPGNFHALLPSSKVRVINRNSPPQNYISKTIPSTVIPSQAISGTVDVVAYNHQNGPFVWSGVKISKLGKHYYCQSGHTSTDTNKPTTTDGLNYWTKDFIHKPSYGTSIDFQYKVKQNKLGDGQYELYPLSTNNLSISLNLLFNNRSERETRAFTHFVEDKAGATEFDFTLPNPYNKRHKFICSNFSIEQIHEDAKNLSATFISENVGTFNWGSIVTPASGIDQNEYYNTNWKKNDILLITGFGGQVLPGFPVLFYVHEDFTAPPDSSSSLSTDYGYSKLSHFRLDQKHFELIGKLFPWKPNLQTRSSHEAKVESVQFNNQYNQRSSLTKNPNRINLNLNFDGRSDKEALAISHFLTSNLGYKKFEYLLPEPFEVTAYPSITGTCSTDINISGSEELDISISPSILLNGSLKHLYENQPVIFENTNSKFNKVYLASGINTNASNIARDTLRVKCKTYAGPIPAGSTFRINPIQARYTCQQWSHTFNFKDNNSLSTSFLHSPVIETSANSITNWNISSDTLDFGSVTTNISHYRKFYIQNLGTSNIIIESSNNQAGIAGDAGTAFKIKSDKRFTLEPMVSKPILIEAYSSLEGSRSTTLTVTSQQDRIDNEGQTTKTDTITVSANFKSAE